MQIQKTKKPKNLNWYFAKAKREFQLYVRLRDSDKNGMCRCCTCGKVVHYKKCDGGHFIRATNRAVCFDERNCHAQCKGCNAFQSGAWEKYLIFMQCKYGQAVVDELNTFRGVTVKRTRSDYEFIIEENKKKSAGLLAKKTCIDE